MAKTKLTDAERDKLRDYTQKMDELTAQEPPQIVTNLTPDEMEQAENYYLKGQGTPPAKLKNYNVEVKEVIDMDGKTRKHVAFSMYTKDWDDWNKKVNALNNEYSDVIVKAMSIWFSAGEETNGQPVSELIKTMLSDDDAALTVTSAPRDLLAEPYVFSLNSKIFNVLYSLSLDDFNKDPYTGLATYENDGVKIELHNYQNLNDITTDELKLWDAAVLYLTFQNYSETQTPRTVVEIPLKEYADARGRSITEKQMDTPEAQARERANAKNRKTDFKKSIHNDLNVLQNIMFSATVTKGAVTENFKNMPLILNNPEITGAPGSEVIRLQFDEQLAKILIKNRQYMRYNMKLQSVNGSNPNTFRVGRHMNLHASIYKNTKAGTDLTLTVENLLTAAPKIPTYEKLQSWGQADNWRNVIKKPLEKILNSLVKSGFLKTWVYRDPKTQNELTPGAITRAKMSWENFKNLRVDYSFVDYMPETPQLEEIIFGS